MTIESINYHCSSLLCSKIHHCIVPRPYFSWLMIFQPLIMAGILRLICFWKMWGSSDKLFWFDSLELHFRLRQFYPIFISSFSIALPRARSTLHSDSVPAFLDFFPFSHGLYPNKFLAHLMQSGHHFCRT